jgi:hypothetical protein
LKKGALVKIAAWGLFFSSAASQNKEGRLRRLLQGTNEELVKRGKEEDRKTSSGYVLGKDKTIVSQLETRAAPGHLAVSISCCAARLPLQRRVRAVAGLSSALETQASLPPWYRDACML